MKASGNVTGLLQSWSSGESDALNRLMPIVYTELRRIARRHMRSEPPGHTLQATALVHEAFLRLAKEKDRTWDNRDHFFRVAAHIMRNLLVDHARMAGAARRGGAHKEVPIQQAPEVLVSGQEELVVLDEALRQLEKVD